MTNTVAVAGSVWFEIGRDDRNHLCSSSCSTRLEFGPRCELDDDGYAPRDPARRARPIAQR